MISQEMKERIFLFLSIAVLIIVAYFLITQTAALGEKIIQTETEVVDTESTSKERETFQYNYSYYHKDLLDIDIIDITEWANRKSYEVVNFMQVLSQPVTITVFIISALYLLVGSIGRGDLAGKGITGMLTSSIVYGLIMYAPLILQSFVVWAAS